MKKKINYITAGLVLTAVLTGCTGNAEKNTDAAVQAVQEETAKENSSDKKEVPDKGSYDPAAFDVSDVYIEPEQEPTTDISGCDTFTQIVDKLKDGMGYANITIGESDLLLVSSGTYEWEQGINAAIDAEIYCYDNGVPTYLGTLAAGGTAYPLALGDGYLYVGGNHFMSTYIVDDGFLIETDEGYVTYDADGSGIYYYKTCNSEFEDYDMAVAESHFNELFKEHAEASVIDFQPVGGGSAAGGMLPAYEYPGPELFYSVLYQYLIDEFGGNYGKSQVTIPCPYIIKLDESDRDDIRVYGDFWIFNYDLKGDILENTSGGSYPGCIHLRSTDSGYEVTGMDIVGDGSEYDPTARKIFGKYYDEFIRSAEDTGERDRIRAQIIANYVAANDLDIKAYQDYGWDPVTLPEENIDSFYSILD